jgi:signal transduction histidine kinase
MTSLRHHLFAALWWSLAIVGAVAATATYLVSRSESNDLLDFQMEQVAALALAQPVSKSLAHVPVPALDPSRDVEDAYIVVIRDPGKQLVYASSPTIAVVTVDWQGYRTQRIGGNDYRIFASRSRNGSVAVGQQLDVRREVATSAALTALLPVVLLIPVLGVVVSYVIRRQLRPLDAAAKAITAGNLRNLQPISAPDLPAELQPLLDEINRLMGRLRAAAEDELRFITDAAHALRTPLTALQLQAEVLENSTTDAQRRVRIGELRAGIRRTVRLTNQLLLLARQQTQSQGSEDFFYVDQALAECRDLYAPAAAARDIKLDLQSATGICVAGTQREILQLAGNLLDNALRHTPDQGVVSIVASAERDGVSIEFVDQGPGVPPDYLDRVFDRFYRAPGDPTEGSGLGLSVVREMADQMGGRVRLLNRADRSGLRACVWLPAKLIPSDNTEIGSAV